MTARPYVFYRYHVEDNKEPLDFRESSQILKNLVGVFVAHRKPQSTDADKDTALVEFRNTLSHKHKDKRYNIIYFSVIIRQTSRIGLDYDRDADELVEKTQRTNDIQRGFVVAIPSLNVMAVRDSSSVEDINAQGTVARLRSIVKAIDGHRLLSELIASAKDVKRAMELWSVKKFNFEAWPFNPHPRRGGEKLEKLLSPERVRARGVITPMKGETITPKEGGFVSQVMELTDNGYAKFGATGETQKGYKSSIEKARPGEGKKIKLKIYIPIFPQTKEHVKAVAETLLEFTDG